MRLEINREAYLRLLQTTDAECIFELVDQNRAYLSEWLPWVDGTQSVDDTKAFLDMVEGHHASEKGVHCCIVFQEQVVGLIGLRFNAEAYVTNIGYWLSAHASGRGLMTRAVQTVCRYAFNELNIERVEIRAATANLRSWRIPERLGFTREGVLRRCEKIADRYLDHYMYSLIRTDGVDWR